MASESPTLPPLPAAFGTKEESMAYLDKLRVLIDQATAANDTDTLNKISVRLNEFNALMGKLMHRGILEITPRRTRANQEQVLFRVLRAELHQAEIAAAHHEDRLRLSQLMNDLDKATHTNDTEAVERVRREILDLTSSMVRPDTSVPLHPKSPVRVDELD